MVICSSPSFPIRVTSAALASSLALAYILFMITLSAEHTAKKHPDVTYAAEFEEAAECALKKLSVPSGPKYPDGYVFVTMGAGDNWKAGKLLLEKLKNLGCEVKL